MPQTSTALLAHFDRAESSVLYAMEQLRAALAALPPAKLWERARAAGLEADAIKDAVHQCQVSAVAALIGSAESSSADAMEPLRADMVAMPPKALWKRARAAGLEADAINDAIHQCQVAAVAELIVSAESRSGGVAAAARTAKAAEERRVEALGGGHHKKHRRRKSTRRKSTRRKSTRRKSKRRKSKRRKSRRRRR